MASPQSDYETQLVALDEVLKRLWLDPPTLALSPVIEFCRQELKYSLIWFARYDSSSKTLVGQGGITPRGDVTMLRQKVALAAGELLDQVIVQRRSLRIPDLRQEQRAGEWRKLAQQCQIQGTLIQPICLGNECLGLVLLGSSFWGSLERSHEQTRLAIILNSLAACWQQQRRQEQPQPASTLATGLPEFLSRVVALPSLPQRLQAAVQELQRTFAAQRACVYWYEPERQSFWRRVMGTSQGVARPGLGRANARDGLATGSGPGRSSNGNGAEPTVTTEVKFSLSESGELYPSLQRGQVISINDTRHSVHQQVPLRLLQQLRVQSWLVAPILANDRLLGFISIEDATPRLWQDSEKQYLQAIAQMLSLAAPQESLEQHYQQAQEEQALLMGLSQPIQSDQAWQDALRETTDQLCRTLQIERVCLLLNDPNTGGFSVSFQRQPPRQPACPDLPPLAMLDWRLLEACPGATAIENLQSDLRFAAWRDLLLKTGVKSLLICSTIPAAPLEGLLLVAQEHPRSWTDKEQRILTVVAQKLGVLVHQWQLQRQAEQQQQLYQGIQRGLTELEAAPDLRRLEQAGLDALQRLVQVPLCALVTWVPGQTQGWLVVPTTFNPKYGVDETAMIAVDQDPLVQAALQQFANPENQSGQYSDSRYPYPDDQDFDGDDSALVMLQAEEIPLMSRSWLTGPAIGQVIAVALQTDPQHHASAVVVLADRQAREWDGIELSALMTLVRHFAWAHRAMALNHLLQQDWRQLETLNWYKHRRLEELYRQLVGSSNQLLNLLSQPGGAALPPQLPLLAKQLQAALVPLPPLLKQESWHLQPIEDTISLPQLIKRSLERVEHVVQQRQIWIQTHNQGGLTLKGDIHKIDLMVYELLLAACHRSRPGGRVDIWCQPIDQKWLEISITDDSEIDPQLLIDLRQWQHQDLLAPSTLDQPPGRHLKACLAMMEQMPGQMEMMKIEDGRTLSRLTLLMA